MRTFARIFLLLLLAAAMTATHGLKKRRQSWTQRNSKNVEVGQVLRTMPMDGKTNGKPALEMMGKDISWLHQDDGDIEGAALLRERTTPIRAIIFSLCLHGLVLFVLAKLVPLGF